MIHAFGLDRRAQMTTLKSIEAEIAKLTKQAQALQNKAVQRVVALMNRLGVSVDDLPRGRRMKRGAASKQPAGVAKYRDPGTGKTWTGRGRAPDWIKNAEDRDVFLVARSDGTAPAKAAKRASKAPAKAARRPANRTANPRKGTARKVPGKAAS